MRHLCVERCAPVSLLLHRQCSALCSHGASGGAHNRASTQLSWLRVLRYWRGRFKLALASGKRLRERLQRILQLRRVALQPTRAGCVRVSSGQRGLVQRAVASALQRRF